MKRVLDTEVERNREIEVDCTWVTSFISYHYKFVSYDELCSPHSSDDNISRMHACVESNTCAMCVIPVISIN